MNHFPNPDEGPPPAPHNFSSLVNFLQSQTGEEPASKTEEEKVERGGEDIHYGEIDFSRLGSKPSSDSAQDSGQQLDTVYAQVNVSKPSNSLTQTADGPKDLYAQVKRN